MRNLKNLYKILLNQYIKDRGFICHSIENIRMSGLITPFERDSLFAHFLSQKPSKKLHPEFTRRIYLEGSAWWELVPPFLEEGREIRINFIEKMIEITE